MAFYDDPMLQYLEEEHQRNKKEEKEAAEILEKAKAFLLNAKKQKEEKQNK